MARDSAKEEDFEGITYNQSQQIRNDPLFIIAKYDVKYVLTSRHCQDHLLDFLRNRRMLRNHGNNLNQQSFYRLLMMAYQQYNGCAVSLLECSGNQRDKIAVDIVQYFWTVFGFKSSNLNMDRDVSIEVMDLNVRCQGLNGRKCKKIFEFDVLPITGKGDVNELKRNSKMLKRILKAILESPSTRIGVVDFVSRISFKFFDRQLLLNQKEVNLMNEFVDCTLAIHYDYYKTEDEDNCDFIDNDTMCLTSICETFAENPEYAVSMTEKSGIEYVRCQYHGSEMSKIMREEKRRIEAEIQSNGDVVTYKKYKLSWYVKQMEAAENEGIAREIGCSVDQRMEIFEGDANNVSDMKNAETLFRKQEDDEFCPYLRRKSEI